MTEHGKHARAACQAGAVEEAGRMVRRVVADHLADGVAPALAAASDVLLLGARRTRAHWCYEVRAVTARELGDLRVAYAGYLRQRQAALADELAALHGSA